MRILAAAALLLLIAGAAGVALLLLYHRRRLPIIHERTANVTRRTGRVLQKKTEKLQDQRILYLAQVQFSDRTYRRWQAVGSKELFNRLPVGPVLALDIGAHFEFAEVILDFALPNETELGALPPGRHPQA